VPETIRHYAAEKLAGAPAGPSEAEDTRRCHAIWYRELAERAENHMLGPEQRTWWDRLDQELANVRAALAWCRAHDAESGLRLAAALWPYWSVRGHQVEAGEWLAQLLERAGPAVPTAARAKALWVAGSFAPTHAPARGRYLAEAEQLFWALGDESGVGRVLEQRAVRAWEGPPTDFPRAEALYIEAIGLARASGDGWLLGRALENYGNMLHGCGASDRARALLEESLAVHRRAGNSWGMAAGLRAIAYRAFVDGDLARAEQLWRDGLALARSLGDRAAMLNCRLELTRVAVARGDLRAAKKQVAELRQLPSDLRAEQWVTMMAEVFLARARGELDRARELAITLLESHEMMELGRPRLFALQNLAMVECERGRPDLGIALTGAIASATNRGDRAYAPDNARCLARARAALGDAGYEQALARGRALKLDEAVAYALATSAD
jgi:hypothetical protein